MQPFMQIDFTPTPNFLLGQQSLTWNPSGAIAELIDNSFGFARGNGNHVWLDYDEAAGTLTVRDNGIGVAEMGRLFQLGNTVGRSPGDIGKYGSGGTLALLWLATQVDVRTMHAGQVSTFSVKWADVIGAKTFESAKRRASWRAPTKAEASTVFPDGQGLELTLHLNRHRSFWPENLRVELAGLYSPGLRNGKSITWMTTPRGRQTLVYPLKPQEFKLEEEEQFSGLVRYEGTELRFSGVVGLSAEELPAKSCKVRVGFGSRRIFETVECFSKGRAKYSGAGITGYIDLGEGWQDHMGTTKNELKNSTLNKALMDFIFDRIEPLLQKSKERRSSLLFKGLSINLMDSLRGLMGGDGGGAEESKEPKDVLTKPKPPKPGADENESHDPPVLKPREGNKPKPKVSDIKVVDEKAHYCEDATGFARMEGNTLTLYVNTDNPLVEALNDKPTPANVRMLRVMLMGVIAERAANDEAMCDALFARNANLMQQIKAKAQYTRAGFIHATVISNAVEFTFNDAD